MLYNIRTIYDTYFAGNCEACTYNRICPISGFNNDIDGELCRFRLNQVRVLVQRINYWYDIGNLSIIQDNNEI